jgi:hypothetical protein
VPLCGTFKLFSGFDVSALRCKIDAFSANLV